MSLCPDDDDYGGQKIEGCLVPVTFSPTHPDPIQETEVWKESLSSTSGSWTLGVSLSGLHPGPKGGLWVLGYFFTKVFTT